MKPIYVLLAASMVPAVASAGIGRAENARKNDACEQARAKAEQTCKDGRAKTLSQCDCVERSTTLYLKNWRCAVQATCEAEADESSGRDPQKQH